MSLAVLSGCQTTASSDSEQTHLLRLHCAGEGTIQSRSRIAVLEVDDPTYHFGLTTGHGVPPNRPCWVRDFMGERSDVDLIRFAENYRVGEQTDWAILRFPKIKTSNLIRYRLEPIAKNERLDGMDISFVSARGLADNMQNCRLSVLNFSPGTTRISHDCRSVAGQSGSPVTRDVDGTPQLIGLHIGQLWMLESPATGRPDRKGYINLLDEKTVAQIERYIAEAR